MKPNPRARQPASAEVLASIAGVNAGDPSCLRHVPYGGGILDGTILLDDTTLIEIEVVG